MYAPYQKESKPIREAEERNKLKTKKWAKTNANKINTQYSLKAANAASKLLTFHLKT